MKARSAPLPEKANWLQLASSHNPEDRQLAHELAPAIAPQVQDELLILFAECSSPFLAREIFNLLSGSHREIAESLYRHEAPPRLRPNHNVTALATAQDPAAKHAILALTRENLLFFSHKNRFVREMAQRSDMTIHAAREYMRALFHASKARFPHAGEEDDLPDMI